MAVFLSNVCKFNSCGLKFPSLPELIRHIEDHHLDVEEIHDRNFLPIGCILRIFSSQDDLNSIDSGTLTESHVRKSVNSPAASLSTTPTEDSEIDEDAGFESDSGQSSIDSWVNIESSTNHLMKFHHIMNSNITSPTTLEVCNMHKVNGKNEEKRFYVCNISGCTKQYRNTNSLSHHRRSVHKISKDVSIPIIKPDESTKKTYKCVCGKIYKTSHGLKSHYNSHHSNQNQNQTNSNVSQAQENNTSRPNLAIIQPNSSNEMTAQQPDNSSGNQFLQINAPMSFEIIPRSKQNNTVKTGTLFNNAEIIPDNSCPPVSVNVEVTSELKPSTASFLKTSPPIISAPTLQQHLLSPIIPKVTNS